MLDIKFDIATREIVIKDNDFALTDNPSVQNGGIIEVSKGANPLQPMLGIGLLPGIIGGPVRRLTFEMNRWRSQVVNDGATLAVWIPGPMIGKNAKVETKISYL